jgi:hypothetical protein
MQRLILVVALVIALPQPGYSQALDALRQGARVEVTSTSGKSNTGTLIALSSDSVRFTPDRGSAYKLNNPASVSLAVADVKSVRVSRGKNHLAGAFSKGLIGTGVGIVGGALLGVLAFRDSEYCDMFCGPGFHATVGGILGGAGGLIVGTVAGATSGNERWERVDLPMR